VGIRAKAPNELWHIDVTIIKLLDGTKAYLHAVIDNFSRRILAWTLEERLGAGVTSHRVDPGLLTTLISGPWTGFGSIARIRGFSSSVSRSAA
jgi:transposase InsO family protein